MPLLSTQWFRFSTRQSKYTRRTNTSIQWMVAKLTKYKPSGSATCNYGSCLKVVFCFNQTKGGKLTRQPVTCQLATCQRATPIDRGGSEKIACGSGAAAEKLLAGAGQRRPDASGRLYPIETNIQYVKERNWKRVTRF